MKEYKISSERVYYCAPNINIGMAVDILGNPTVEQLKQSIIKAVASHELLCCSIQQDYLGECYYLPKKYPNIKIEVRKMKTFEDWKEIILEEQRIPFNLEAGELIRFYILQAKDLMQLIVISHHLAGDGNSITYLIQDIMMQLSGESISTNQKRMKLVEEKDFPQETNLKGYLKPFIFLLNRKWKQEGRRFENSEYLNMFENYWRNQQNAINHVNFNEQFLSNLLAISKKNHVSLNSLIVTAYLSVSQAKKLGVAVSIRPLDFKGMGNYASIIKIQYSYNSKKTFWENAQCVQKLIYQSLNDNQKKFFLVDFFKALSPTLIDSIYFNTLTIFSQSASSYLKNLLGFKRESSNFGISNLTRVDIATKYGKFEINNLIFLPPLIFNSQQILGVATLNNKLNITMHYNKKNHQQKSVFKEMIEVLENLVK